MYLTPLKAAVVEAFRATFNDNYPNTDFRNVLVSIEYPVVQESYPSLWVTYEDTEELTIASIGHIETTFDPVAETYTQVNRWKFKGIVTVTSVALSSLERDRLYDEVVRTFAFGRQNEALNVFRDLIEQNDLIAMNFNFDDLQPSGDAAAMGTPWQTDEMIYEKSLSIVVQGEFVGDPSIKELVPLSKVLFNGYPEGTEPSTFPDGQPATDQIPTEFDPTSWH
jgi:hypothetical protein